jgi:sugar/nucleoside kinase (ribokinase family)
LRAPEFLVVGHVVQDLTGDEGQGGTGSRLGGTACYAASLAERLGLRTGILTAAATDLPLDETLPSADVVRAPSADSTQMRNVYTAEGRVQYVPRRASRIDARRLPDAWRDAEIVLLGPVADEVDEALASCFPQALIGVSAQGWLRDIGADGMVRPLSPEAWRADAILKPAHVLVVSDEDLPPSGTRAVLERWSRRVDVLAYTRAERGAEVCHEGVWRHIDAFPAEAVDPTGAGDVFAAAFLIRYRDTDDAWEATRFASCAASFVIESEGLANIPDQAMIEARLREHPEIVAVEADVPGSLV